MSAKPFFMNDFDRIKPIKPAILSVKNQIKCQKVRKYWFGYKFEIQLTQAFYETFFLENRLLIKRHEFKQFHTQIPRGCSKGG